MKLNLTQPLVLLVSIILISSCTENTPEQEESSSTPTDTSESTTFSNNLSEDEARILTLPTPIQFAALMSAYGIPYNQELLIPIDETRAYSSNFTRSICSGFCAINLGYSAIAGDNVNSIKYFEHMSNLLNEMSVQTYPANEVQKRFGDNIESPDSLSKIILETYDKAHKYLIANEQEKEGFLILAGSYIAGLELVSKAYLAGNFKRRKQVFHNIYSQNQIFLNNLMEVSSNLNDKDADVIELDNFLQDLDSSFSKLSAKT